MRLCSIATVETDFQTYLWQCSHLDSRVHFGEEDVEIYPAGETIYMCCSDGGIKAILGDCRTVWSVHCFSTTGCVYMRIYWSKGFFFHSEICILAYLYQHRHHVTEGYELYLYCEAVKVLLTTLTSGITYIHILMQHIFRKSSKTLASHLQFIFFKEHCQSN